MFNRSRDAMKSAHVLDRFNQLGDYNYEVAYKKMLNDYLKYMGIPEADADSYYTKCLILQEALSGICCKRFIEDSLDYCQ